MQVWRTAAVSVAVVVLATTGTWRAIGGDQGSAARTAVDGGTASGTTPGTASGTTPGTASGTTPGTTSGTAPGTPTDDPVGTTTTGSTGTSTGGPVTPVTGSASSAPVTDLVSAPTGDLPGWKQVFLDDFDTPVAEGSFPGRVYGSRWTGYDGFADNSGRGLYATSKVTSVHDGLLDMSLRSEGGQALAAAPVPLVDGTWGGSTYGRYSIRFRSDPIPGYGAGWLLWSDANRWSDGEIDFPEGLLNGTIAAFNHLPGDTPEVNAFATDTGASWSQWHTATTEWTPDGVRFLLDGRTIGVSTVSPDAPMHLVLQTGTSRLPVPPGAGHVYVDWVAMWTWNP